MEENAVGLHRLNAFMVPTELLKIADRLNKPDLIGLLKVLAGETTDQGTMDRLRTMGLLNKTNNNINWVANKQAPIKMLRITAEGQQALHELSTGELKPIKEIIDDLPKDLKKLLTFYATSLKLAGIKIQESHIRNWVAEMQGMETSPAYAEAISAALKKENGKPAYIAAIIKSKEVTRGKSQNANTREDW